MRPGPWLSLLLALSVPALAGEPPAELTVYYFERMPFFGDRDGEARSLGGRG